MLITLYKNCILTDSYSEVFDVFHKDSNGKTALERYLATLEHKDITAGDVYVTGSGKIPFALKSEDGDFYQYNYMRVLNEVTGFARYCFIDAIAVVSNTAVVSYIEDIWSNYAETMHMRKSLLTRSRILNYGTWQVPFYSQGMEYQGNNQLQFERLTTLSGNVAIFAQVQTYNLSQQGSISDREVLNCRIIKTDSTDFTINGAIDTINEFVRKSSDGKVKKVNDTTYNYESFNFMIVPIEYCDNSGSDVESVITVEGQSIVLNVLTAGNVGVTTATKNLPCNFKQFKIGTFANAFDIVQNGTNIFVSIEQRNTTLETMFYLKFQNQIIDISSSFKYVVPITVQTADVTQQQATSREIATLSAKIGTVAGGMKIAEGIFHLGTGAGQIGVGISTGSPTSAIKGINSMVGAVSEIGTGAMNVIAQKKQLEIANRAMYVTNKGTSVTNSAIVNAMTGVVIYEIIADNETEVQANINNTGYVCNEIVDDILRDITTGTANKYNVMSFDYVNIYGKFTQRIASVLRDILYGGFKIWYDETAINE